MIHGASEISIYGAGYSGEAPYCLEIPNFISTSGVNVQLNYCNGGENQKWVFTQAGLIVGEWGLCLKYEGDGNNLQVVTCDAAVNVNWASNGPGNAGYGILGSIWLQSDISEYIVGPGNPGYFTPGAGVVAAVAYQDYEGVFWQQMNRQPVALVPEEGHKWCWLSVSQMAMGYIGIDGIQGPPQCEEANIESVLLDGGAANCCTTQSPATIGLTTASTCDVPGAIHQVLKAYGFLYAEQTYSPTSLPSFSLVQSEIRAGRTLPANINSACHHSVLIIGADVDAYNNEWVVYNDPWGDDQTTGLGEQVALPWDIFANEDPSAYTGCTLTNAYTGVEYPD